MVTIKPVRAILKNYRPVEVSNAMSALGWRGIDFTRKNNHMTRVLGNLPRPEIELILKKLGED